MRRGWFGGRGAIVGAAVLTSPCSSSRLPQVRERELHAGRDESFDTYVLDEASEDRLLDMMEDMVAEGGCIVDFHSSELFPIRWFDLVLVLRCNNTVLYDRLLGRGYSEKKITENVTAEIMGVAEEEARESYPEEAVHTLASETVEQADANLERLVVWHGTWLEEHSAGAGHA